MVKKQNPLPVLRRTALSVEPEVNTSAGAQTSDTMKPPNRKVKYISRFQQARRRFWMVNRFRDIEARINCPQEWIF